MTLPYKINYTPSFVVFWGLVFAIATITNGLLSIALIAMLLLLLVHHEHSHAAMCIKLGIKINEIRFNWLGGCVICETIYARDCAKILAAGVINTGMYAIAFILPTALVYYLRPIGFNFAPNPYLAFVDTICVVLIAFMVMITIPLSYRHKTLGLITTDGWGIILMNRLAKEKDDELWNDGARVALDQRRFFRVD